MTRPAPRADLRLIRRAGGPPPLPPEPVKPTKEQRVARAEHTKAIATFESAQRNDPLPPDVWIVRQAGKYAALQVLGPGDFELWASDAEAVQRYR